jgi:hypothetical protein
MPDLSPALFKILVPSHKGQIVIATKLLGVQDSEEAVGGRGNLTERRCHGAWKDLAVDPFHFRQAQRGGRDY